MKFLDPYMLFPIFYYLPSKENALGVVTLNQKKFSNGPIQNLFNFPQRTSMDFCNVI